MRGIKYEEIFIRSVKHRIIFHRGINIRSVSIRNAKNLVAVFCDATNLLLQFLLHVDS